MGRSRSCRIALIRVPCRRGREAAPALFSGLGERLAFTLSPLMLRNTPFLTGLYSAGEG